MSARGKVLVRGTFVCLAIIVPSRPADAQFVTVQQPVVQQFQVQTVVSVPDRGSVLLGSVARGTTFGRSTGGGFGSTRSGEAMTSGVSAHVWIHDFDEMDRLLLSAAAEPSPRSLGQPVRPARPDLAGLSAMPAHAAECLLRRHVQMGRQTTLSGTTR
jgi:hypothetical protein